MILAVRLVTECLGNQASGRLSRMAGDSGTPFCAAVIENSRPLSLAEGYWDRQRRKLLRAYTDPMMVQTKSQTKLYFGKKKSPISRNMHRKGRKNFEEAKCRKFGAKIFENRILQYEISKRFEQIFTNRHENFLERKKQR